MQAPGLGGAGVDIAGSQGAADGGRAGDGTAVVIVAGFGNGAEQLGGGVGDHRDVVGAFDGDGQCRGADIAISVGDRVGKGVSYLLPLR